MSARHTRSSRSTALSVTTGPDQVVPTSLAAAIDAKDTARPARTVSFFLLVLAASLMFGFSHVQAQPLVFVDWSWDSALVHNRIAGFVAEHGFGYEVDYLFADTVPGIQGLRRGDIDVSMETWVDNIQEIWDEIIAEGTVVDLGSNFPNAPQGWYVPTYVIEGDPERASSRWRRNCVRCTISPGTGSFSGTPKTRAAAGSTTAPRAGSCRITT